MSNLHQKKLILSDSQLNQWSDYMNKLYPNQKIKVFISSKCDKAGGISKYNPVRAELKELIESTNLATVYTFENESGSTLSAGSHFTYALEDADICIFLIDNADGIPEGVQSEINTARKKKKMALYYFCDENSNERTELEKSLEGAVYAKSQTVHHFKDLTHKCAQALIDDITLIYHCYCTKRIVECRNDDIDLLEEIDIQTAEKPQEISFPKVILKNIDKSIKHILSVAADCHYSPLKQKVQTSDLDDWGDQFLDVLLEGKSIKEFNVSLFLKTLKEMQSEDFFNVVSLRWLAIQSYFSGNVQECINNLQNAYDLAKSTNQAIWIVKDILIDLRNQHWELATLTNTYFESEAQNTLDCNAEELYYPVLDRINETLQEKYFEGFYNKRTASPYAIELGRNLNQLGALLTSAYIIALYNGSLTHIILLYDKVKNFLFYLSDRYDDWKFKRNLLKFTIFNGNAKEVSRIIDTYPEILKELSAEEADTIMKFSATHPIKYKRIIRKLIAFGKVGYYLNDTSFAKYEKEIIEDIECWIKDNDAVVNVGQYVFSSLSDVIYRMPQDSLSKICCSFMDRHFSRWYIDMFKFMSNGMNLNKMSSKSACNLIDHIISILKNKKECELIKTSPYFLINFRIQSQTLTEELDNIISEYLPNFYNFEYKLRTTENRMEDYPVFLENIIDIVHKSNIEQDKNGIYVSYKGRDIAIITSILRASNFNYSEELMDKLIYTVTETLIESREDVSMKLDAVLLLSCIVIKYPQDYIRNHNLYENVIIHESEIYIVSDSLSNISSLALKIGLKMLFSLIGSDIYTDVIELLPLIINDTATAIKVTDFIAGFLEISNSFVLDKKIEPILLYNTFEWLQMDFTVVRQNATRIMLALTRNNENDDIIIRKIISLIESDNVYIKNLILRKISDSNLLTKEIRDRVFSICENDCNFVTRMVCREFKLKK